METVRDEKDNVEKFNKLIEDFVNVINNNNGDIKGSITKWYDNKDVKTEFIYTDLDSSYIAATFITEEKIDFYMRDTTKRYDFVLLTEFYKSTTNNHKPFGTKKINNYEKSNIELSDIFSYRILNMINRDEEIPVGLAQVLENI